MARIFVSSPYREESAYLQRTLERAGYQVSRADSFQDEIPLLLSETYDLIINRQRLRPHILREEDYRDPEIQKALREVAFTGKPALSRKSHQAL